MPSHPPPPYSAPDADPVPPYIEVDNSPKPLRTPSRGSWRPRLAFNRLCWFVTLISVFHGIATQGFVGYGGSLRGSSLEGYQLVAGQGTVRLPDILGLCRISQLTKENKELKEEGLAKDNEIRKLTKSWWDEIVQEEKFLKRAEAREKENEVLIKEIEKLKEEAVAKEKELIEYANLGFRQRCELSCRTM